MITFSLVDVKNIHSNVPRSDFDESELDRLADVILECGGIVKPLILQLQDLDNYEVISGHLEYYAAVRVKEKDPRKGEMVNAFVIAAKREANVLEQVRLLKRMGDDRTPATTPPTTASDDGERLTNLEIRLERSINQINRDLKTYQEETDRRIKGLESRQKEAVNPLDLLNRLSPEDLCVRLKRSHISGSEKLAKAIVDARTKKGQFEDYQDAIAKVKGLAEKTMIRMIDSWSISMT